MRGEGNITHLTEALGTGGGGVSVALRGLCGGLMEQGWNQKVVGFSDDGLGAEEAWSQFTPELIARSSPLRELSGGSDFVSLQTSLDKSSILHTHGLWTRLSVLVPRLAKESSRPYVVSPHGMLDKWALAQSKNKKRIARFLFENKHLNGAACLHALCEEEAVSLRACGLRNPIAVIPNGIDLPELSDPKPKNGTEISTLLFIGRLHPKKGLTDALKMWARSHETMATKGWRFVIAGWNQGGHEEELVELCEGLQLPFRKSQEGEQVASMLDKQSADGEVLFLGPVFGSDKAELFQQSDAFVLPSRSEGLPMSILEAWSYALPVLMTKECHLTVGFASGAALKWSNDGQVLTEFLTLSSDERSDIGQAGRKLVERYFTWEQVTRSLTDVYHWILSGGEPPKAIQTIQ